MSAPFFYFTSTAQGSAGKGAEKARQIIARSEERSRQLYQVANEYAEDALARTEEAVQAALDEVKQSRVRFRTASAAKMQEQRDKLDGKAEQQTADGEN